MTELYCKMATYRNQKRSQATKEGFRNIVQTCRGGVKKAKAQLELARHQGRDKELQPLHEQKKAKQDVGSLLGRVLDFMAAKMENSQIASTS